MAGDFTTKKETPAPAPSRGREKETRGEHDHYRPVSAVSKLFFGFFLDFFGKFSKLRVCRSGLSQLSQVRS
jgi:hypothetical protein